MVATLKRPTDDDLGSPDLSGPVVIALALGFLLLFSGKIHFGDIYGVSLVGTVLLYFLLNFMSEVQTVLSKRVTIPVYDVMSILGYGLLPMLALGLINIFIHLKGPLGLILGVLCTAWSSYASSMFFEVVMKLHNKKWLVAYPVFLFYLTFVLITIF